MDDASIDLLLFTTDLAEARHSLDAGIDGFVIDWETAGKHDRQRGVDTEINSDTAEDVERLRSIRGARRFCRINRFGEWTPREIDEAIAAGATHLLLPMVETPREVEAYLRLVDARVHAGILVETRAACDAAPELAKLPLDRVYVGLNDLSISRRSPTLFEPFIDGLALALRECFEGTPFGIGGLTVVDRGAPVPALLLMSELARHDCHFTFLRRSFKRDVAGRDLPGELRAIHREWARLSRRSSLEIERDHAAFLRACAR